MITKHHHKPLPLIRLALAAITASSVFLLPTLRSEDTSDLPTSLERRGDFATLLTAIEAAGLVETLRSEGSFTLFAPTDGASVLSLTEATSDQKHLLRISATDILTIKQANVVETDLNASNGIIHIIDAVLVPDFEPHLKGSVVNRHLEISWTVNPIASHPLETTSGLQGAPRRILETQPSLSGSPDSTRIEDPLSQAFSHLKQPE